MKTVLLSVCLSISMFVAAQDSVKTKRPAFLSGVATYDFALSYGFSTLASIPFCSAIRHSTDNSLQPRHRDHVWILSTEFGIDHRPLAYTSILANAGVGMRFTKSEKRFTELCLFQGILRTIYEGDVYQVQADGNIKERTFFGRTYATTGFCYSQNWSVSTRNTWFMQLKPSLWAQYPYNSFFKPHLSLQAGISYRLKDIPIHIRTIKYSS